LQGSVETALLHPVDARNGFGGEGVGLCAVNFVERDGALLGVEDLRGQDQEED